MEEQNEETSGIEIPGLDDHRVLRHVTCDGYRLLMWDTNRTDDRYGKSVLGYAFYAPGADKPLFVGEDFCCSPANCVDSNETVCSLLGFLTLRPGDTDREWFENYTPEQMAFAEGDAEQLQMFALERDAEDEQWPYWENIDGWEDPNEDEDDE